MADPPDPMHRFRWPELGEPYDTALRQTVAFVLGRTSPLGIIAAGSIVRGVPDPGSDLDIYVIHADPHRFRAQRWFSGVPAEVFVNPPASVRGYMAEERRSGRPCTAHMLATGFVVLHCDPVIAELRAEAEESLRAGPDVTEETLLYRRYLTADTLDNARDAATGDPACANLILHTAVQDMLSCYFLIRGEFIPSAKRVLATVREQAPHLAALVEGFCSAADTQARLALADRIADATIGVRGFFEWESAPQRVDPPS